MPIGPLADPGRTGQDEEDPLALTGKTPRRVAPVSALSSWVAPASALRARSRAPLGRARSDLRSAYCFGNASSSAARCLVPSPRSRRLSLMSSSAMSRRARTLPTPGQRLEHAHDLELGEHVVLVALVEEVAEAQPVELEPGLDLRPHSTRLRSFLERSLALLGGERRRKGHGRASSEGVRTRPDTRLTKTSAEYRQALPAPVGPEPGLLRNRRAPRRLRRPRWPPRLRDRRPR